MPISTAIRFNDFWIDKALNKLFESEEKRMNAWMLSLCIKHASLVGGDCFGFKYKGERYIPEEYQHFMKKTKELPTLNITLSQKVIEFYTEIQRLGKDKAQIRQLFSVLLMRCESRQNVRNALPECVVALLELQDEYPREFPETDLLNPVVIEQYHRLLPKIQMYSVVHLINS